MNRAVRPLALAAALLLTAGLVACGTSDSSSKEAAATTTKADDRAATTTTAPSDADESPCNLYAAEDMATQMGVDEVTVKVTATDPPACTYTSGNGDIETVLTLLDADQFAALPRDAASYSAAGSATPATVLPDPGSGDESFAISMDGGVFVAARVGDVGYSMLSTNAGVGEDAGAWTDNSVMVDCAVAVIDSSISHS